MTYLLDTNTVIALMKNNASVYTEALLKSPRKPPSARPIANLNSPVATGYITSLLVIVGYVS